MQDNSSAIVRTTTDLTKSFAGGDQSDVSMMVGIGLIKDSDAVFFQYVGNEQPPVALIKPNSGRPLTRLSNVVLTGIGIAEDVGEFNSTKLNLYIQAQDGTTMLITSGLTTLWSQYCLTGLMALFQHHRADSLFHLDTWKGTSKMKPCFAAIRSNGVKVNDDQLKEQLIDAKADKDEDRTDQLLRDAVEAIRIALAGNAPQPVDVQVLDPNTDEIPF